MKSNKISKYYFYDIFLLSILLCKQKNKCVIILKTNIKLILSFLLRFFTLPLQKVSSPLKKRYQKKLGNKKIIKKFIHTYVWNNHARLFCLLFPSIFSLLLKNKLYVHPLYNHAVSYKFHIMLYKQYFSKIYSFVVFYKTIKLKLLHCHICILYFTYHESFKKLHTVFLRYVSLNKKFSNILFLRYQADKVKRHPKAVRLNSSCHDRNMLFQILINFKYSFSIYVITIIIFLMSLHSKSDNAMLISWPTQKANSALLCYPNVVSLTVNLKNTAPFKTVIRIISITIRRALKHCRVRSKNIAKEFFPHGISSFEYS